MGRVGIMHKNHDFYYLISSEKLEQAKQATKAYIGYKEDRFSPNIIVLNLAENWICHALTYSTRGRYKQNLIELTLVHYYQNRIKFVDIDDIRNTCLEFQ